MARIPTTYPMAHPNSNTPRLIAKPMARPSYSWSQALWVLIPLAVVVGLAAAVDLILAGVIYLLAFICISFWKPEIAMFLSFGLCMFVNDLSLGGPVKFSIGELNLALCLPAFLIVAVNRIRLAPFLMLSLLYIGICFMSSLLNSDKEAVAALAQTILYLIIAVVVFSSFLDNPMKFQFILDGAVFTITVYALIGLATDYHFLDTHKNAWGAALASGMIITAEMFFAANTKKRKWWLRIATIIMAVALMLTLSRGAWMAAIAGLTVIACMRRQFKLVIRTLLILAPIILLLWMFMPEEKKEYAIGFDTKRENIEARLITIDTALKYFKEQPLIGRGISLRKHIDATNVIVITMAETGIIGLAAFLFMHAGLLMNLWRTQKLIPRMHPLYSPVALGGALVIGRLAHGCVDHYWSRGAILQAWAAAGMATAIYYTLKNRPKSAVPHYYQPTSFLPK